MTIYEYRNLKIGDKVSARPYSEITLVQKKYTPTAGSPTIMGNNGFYAPYCIWKVEK